MKKALILILILFFVAEIKAQETERRLSDRVMLGGNFGLAFGTKTYIELSPQIGYRITPKVLAAVSLTYIYLKDSRYNYSTSIYGGSVFSQYHFSQRFFLHGEIEFLNLDYYTNYDEKTRVWVDSYLVGAGYRTPLGERLAANIVILWNLNETTKSPYTNPIIRLGFSF